ncbi:MAG TPA: hypothetical protein VNZ57_05355, partial [Longimicrobiales bacterium]|nr:hypothetical protein [Longimicrobiales bacterium]
MRPGNSFGLLAVVGILLATAGCASSGGPAAASPTVPFADALRPTPDPRIGLSAGILNAGQAIWNMRLLSTVATPEPFVGANNSDLAFKDSYVIQGNYRGFQVWDISDPAAPELLSAQICPGAQGDVSVYGNLLFVSTEYLDGRLDCGAEPSNAAVSPDRLRGIRIFDISDIRNPEYIASVQTCRGSHTHSLLVPPDDPDHVYVYVSGSAPVRPAEEMPGCSDAPLSVDPNSSLFRIEVIRVPLADPSRAEIVSSPRIFADLGAPPLRSPTEAELADIQARRQREFANGQFVAVIDGAWWRLAPETATMFLDSIVAARGGSGAPTAADSLALFEALPELLAARLAAQGRPAREGPDQCHDITIYPAIGLAGGACEGFGLLLDISNPIDPRRIAAAADTNFS